ncbi:MAG: GDP-mannose 4,6-dehydratase [bacterium]
MTKILVTGAAGFIGSHLAEKLVAMGYDVVGVDCFTDYYSGTIKTRNLEPLKGKNNFRFSERKIQDAEKLRGLLNGIEYVFHLAAQPGVRASWGRNFEVYVENNITATQVLLEELKDSPVKKFIFASSSSVYGDAEKLPTHEDTPPQPVSPYGVTKLASEHLCASYWKNYGVPVVMLRYFTVYGPRQRPDMAFSRIINAAISGETFQVYGDGNQTRDFTYIDDAVNANLLAMETDAAGEAFNIGGGARISLNEIIKILENLTSKKIHIEYRDVQRGDVKHTCADISKAETILKYSPSVKIEDGLKNQVEYCKK